MKLGKRPPPDVWMQLTSLIDVIFLLLIFFMCATELNKMENEAITLPLALKAREDSGETLKNRVTVTIAQGPGTDANNKWELRIQRKNFNLQDLQTLIDKRAIENGKDDKGICEMPVKIRADAACPYKYVQKVMDICAHSGVYKISFGVSPREGGRSVQKGSGFGAAVTSGLRDAASPGGGGTPPAPAPAPAPTSP